MKKKGFTLIELLAVIVILAIIALIAVPIVLNIISDTKNSAILRGADFYLDAVELSIAQAILDGGSIDGSYTVAANGNICKGEDCIQVEVQGDTPDSGSTITITDGQISSVSLNYANKTVIKDNNELVFSGDNNGSNNPICRPATEQEKGAGYIAEGSYEPGDSYICEVKDGVEYLFYVLSTNNASNEVIESTTTDKTVSSVNLIMSGNIYYDSESGASSLATSTNPGFVAWYAEAIDDSYGPVTAMQYLHNATKSWSNIPDMIMNYTDEGQGEGIIGTDEETGEYIIGETGYGGITTTNGVTTITKRDGTVTLTIEEPLKARMPKKSEIADYDEEVGNHYLYDNLELRCLVSEYDWNDVSCDEAGYKYGVDLEGVSHINEIIAYWALSTRPNVIGAASNVHYSGYINDAGARGAANNVGYGVRPVITIPTSMLSQ